MKSKENIVSSLYVKSYMFLFAGLLPLWPALRFIEKNKYEQDFDVLWLISAFTIILLSLTLVYLVGRFFKSHLFGSRLFVLASAVLCFFQFYYDVKIFLFQDETVIKTLSIFGVGVFVVAWLSWKIGKSNKILPILSIYSIAITLLSIAPIIKDPGTLRLDIHKLTPTAYSVDEMKVEVKDAAGLPNVYYYVFDGYLRSDLLKKHYGYNNDAFVMELKNKGFLVDSKSRSNFPTTRYSLNYTLNPSFANESVEDLPKRLRENRSFTGHTHSEVEKDFRNRGYEFAMLNHQGKNVPACKPNCIATDPSVTFVQIQFLKNTPIYDVIKNYYPGVLWSWLSDVPNDNRYSLDNFPGNIAKPFFLFSHALIPHPPYTVNDDCSPYKTGVVDFNLEFKRDWDFLRLRYLDQISCSNHQMLEIADRLNKTDPSAIIFFISDHGWKANHAKYDIPKQSDRLKRFMLLTRASNFMSVRAPEACLRYYKEGMTLVNSFPFIFACLDKVKPDYIDNRSYVINGKNSNIRIEDVTKLVAD